jgi:hypothetical protein
MGPTVTLPREMKCLLAKLPLVFRLRWTTVAAIGLSLFCFFAW